MGDSWSEITHAWGVVSSTRWAVRIGVWRIGRGAHILPQVFHAPRELHSSSRSPLALMA